LRMDAHSAPAPNYVELSVRNLEEGKGDNVGGVWQIQPQNDSWIARSIAVAAAHPVGVGDALYRHASKSAFVDTVPFGAFYRTLMDKLGGYDESLLTNEDYELNTRISKQGGKIWLDSDIYSKYIARGDINSLAKQYYRYGFWKLQMLKRYPGTIRWRQFLPPVLVLSIFFLFIAGLFAPILFWLLLIEIVAYWLILILVISPRAIREKDGGLLIGFPLSVATMHFSWGTGFILSIFKSNKK
jgi:succinoglycan biosynthesis protein ExoA